MTKPKHYVLGVDEVGTGALAGPITVAACFVPTEHWDTLKRWGFRDCKRLGVAKRARVMERLEAEAASLGVVWGMSSVDPIHIDLLSPPDAFLRAARTAVILATHKLDATLREVTLVVDGEILLTNLPGWVEQIAIPKADRHYLPVAVASVIARRYRDVEMRRLDQQYPGYQFLVNDGYATLDHLTTILKTGPVYGVHRKHYLRKAVAKAYDAYFTNVFKRPRWLDDNSWLTNVEDEGVTIKATWPVINPYDPIYQETPDERC